MSQAIKEMRIKAADTRGQTADYDINTYDDWFSILDPAPKDIDQGRIIIRAKAVYVDGLNVTQLRDKYGFKPNSERITGIPTGGGNLLSLPNDADGQEKIARLFKDFVNGLSSEAFTHNLVATWAKGKRTIVSTGLSDKDLEKAEKAPFKD